jgi:hypothetical protein
MRSEFTVHGSVRTVHAVCAIRINEDEELSQMCSGANGVVIISSRKFVGMVTQIYSL